MSTALALNLLSSLFLLYSFHLSDKKTLVITGLVGKSFGIGYWITTGDLLVATMVILISIRNIWAINFHHPNIRKTYFIFFILIFPLFYLNYSGPQSWVALFCYLCGTVAYMRPLHEMRIIITFAASVWFLYEYNYGMLPSQLLIVFIVLSNLYKIFNPDHGFADKVLARFTSRS